MPVPVQRIISSDVTRNTGVLQSDFEMTGLTKIQTDSYARFLQADVDPARRKPVGLEEILREIFPIESFDGQFRLEYVKYELG
ncbi:hypothetical protein, partial [uncultured Rubinisphaera sp.]|uniref:hypothetical protein n=1 Tax=uncultured Rubinisphaera sp. TaxID=1678686 RepID=UPI0030D737A7